MYHTNINDVYKDAMHHYGYVTLYFLMKEYIFNEQYEDCETLNKFFKQNYIPISNNYEENIKELFSKFKLTGDIYRKNMPYYLEEIKNNIKKINS